MAPQEINALLLLILSVKAVAYLI